MMRILSIVICFALSIHTMAQDTTKKTIEITSSFKPVLRSAEKIDFQATPPPPDTTRPKFQYSIPAQNVIPQLTPVALKPLTVALDTSAKWINHSFIKAGFGNLKTPYLRAGLSVPTGKSRFNVMANHISSSGKIQNQDYGETNVVGQLSSTLDKRLLLDIHAGFAQDKYYLFGYEQNLFKYKREDLKQAFSTIEAGASIRNDIPTEFGITYNPQVNVAVFSDNHQNSESNLVVKVPIEKYIGKSFGLNVGVEADITRFTRSQLNSITNNLVQIPVSIRLRTPDLQFNAGVIPSWDNSAFTLLPNVEVSVPISGDKWILQGGWLSYYQKEDYRHLAQQNPFLSTPSILRNQRTVERYAGFKGTILEHITYSGKVGYVEYYNKPLFVNDTISGKQFDVIYEEQLKALQFQAEIGYLKAESFSISSRVNAYTFNGQKTTASPWGVVPVEFTTRLRWNVLKDLTLTSDLFMWQGPLYVNRKTGVSGRLNSAADLSAGLEFKVTKRVLVWSQFNNIFNTAYQRWNQYHNYGFNMLMGGIFRFNQ